MRYLQHIRRHGWLITSYALLALILFTTNPYQSSLLLVIVPFALLFIALALTGHTLFTWLPFGRRLTPKKRLFFAIGAGWLPVMLLILRSIDQLTFRDGVILVIFIVAFLLYVSRTNFTAS